MHSKLSAAYAVWHYAQYGSGTYTDGPGSFREADCCLLAVPSQAGTVCTWRFLHHLGMQRLPCREEGYIWVVGDGWILSLGTRFETAMVQRWSSKVLGIA